MTHRWFFYIFLMLLIVTGSYFVFSNNTRTYISNEIINTENSVFPTLPVNDIDTLIVSNQYGKSTLKKIADQWYLQEKENYPASNARINEIIIALSELLIMQKVNLHNTHWEDLHLLDDQKCQQSGCSTKVELYASNRYYASLLSGKLMASNSDAAQIFGESYDGHQFIRTPANDQVFLVNQSLNFLNTMTSNWVKNQWPTQQQSQSVRYIQNNKKIWQLYRDGINSPYQLIDETTQISVTLPKLSQTIDYAFSSILIRDVMPSNIEKSKFHINDDHYIEFENFNSEKYRLYIGGKTSISKQAQQRQNSSVGMLSTSSTISWRFVNIQWPNGRNNTLDPPPYENRVYLIASPLLDKLLISHDEMVVFEKLSPSL